MRAALALIFLASCGGGLGSRPDRIERAQGEGEPLEIMTVVLDDAGARSRRVSPTPWWALSTTRS